jgi:hypothetical protein
VSKIDTALAMLAKSGNAEPLYAAVRAMPKTPERKRVNDDDDVDPSNSEWDKVVVAWHRNLIPDDVYKKAAALART